MLLHTITAKLHAQTVRYFLHILTAASCGYALYNLGDGNFNLILLLSFWMTIILCLLVLLFSAMSNTLHVNDIDRALTNLRAPRYVRKLLNWIPDFVGRLAAIVLMLIAFSSPLYTLGPIAPQGKAIVVICLMFSICSISTLWTRVIFKKLLWKGFDLLLPAFLILIIFAYVILYYSKSLPYMIIFLSVTLFILLATTTIPSCKRLP